ncbi:hypothetical protein ACWFR1_02425 [Streptomyces sp. NPDC055103]
MAKTPDELSTEIADLKKALFAEANQEVKYTIENKDATTKEEKPFIDTTAAVASALKKHLIDVVPRITTESFFLPIVQQIKEIHTEVTKNRNVELLEATPFLGGIAAAWEKWYESKEEGADVQWQLWLAAALGGMALVTLLPAIRGVIVNWWRDAQARGDDNKRVWTKNADGGWQREALGNVKAREQRVWNGGTSLADLVSDPANAERARKLREQLVPLNKAVDRFDKLAPTFLESFRKLPSERKATKAANGVEKISEAVKLVDRPALKEVAGSVEKLNKESGLASTARKMGELTNKTETLRKKFQDLRGTITNLDQTIAGSSG